MPSAVNAIAPRVALADSAEARASDYTELLIGLERVGIDGGSWEGVEIRYSVDGRSYTLLVEHDMRICGASVSCEIPNH